MINHLKPLDKLLSGYKKKFKRLLKLGLTMEYINRVDVYTVRWDKLGNEKYKLWAWVMQCNVRISSHRSHGFSTDNRCNQTIPGLGGGSHNEQKCNLRFIQPRKPRNHAKKCNEKKNKVRTFKRYSELWSTSQVPFAPSLPCLFQLSITLHI